MTTKVKILKQTDTHVQDVETTSVLKTPDTKAKIEQQIHKCIVVVPHKKYSILSMK